ncbi:MAG: hypothetical protein GWN84_09275 [Gammaproteobacteria bacterium]|nr:hypothetical protein [Gammaproteobacteria bacterium]NIR83064.1 hypothetical protein [Gammaproteobacteria bacterium]NIR90726.1 hypothetical protein [Gammaproteobacteria bacterium]NIU04217.1 hypothetical protein [Gammaproteobacteria bacterium]NIV51509.1 hypothetical protein [Gammaproteobacteria bacterium]
MRCLTTASGRWSRAAPAVRAGGILACLLLSGCAAVPSAISEPPPSDVQLVEVLRDGAAAYEGTPVRWGGTIMSMTPRDGESWLEILERKLDNEGEPLRGVESDGRFLAVLAAGSEASSYPPGRDITVSGVVEGAFEGSIGGRSYTFPVVRTETSYVWDPHYYAYYPPGYYGGYYYLGRYRPFPHVYVPYYYGYPYGWHPYFY